MPHDTRANQVVFTNKAKCRDCYRCLRNCPVKAIRMSGGQAQVVPERCLACGTCIRQCPQGAKSYRMDLERARELLAGAGPVAASVAPSFAGLLSPARARRLPSALRRLGFARVEETAVGAWHVAGQTAEFLRASPARPCVTTCCPAVVEYVERYRPGRIDQLIPLASPMIAHARLLKERLGPTWSVIFIGPCVAKKAEADRPRYAGLVDCVLTFEELQEWLDREGIDLDAFEESDFDQTPGPGARFFPVPGGLARAAGLGTDLLDTDVVAVTGAGEVIEALDAVAPRADRVLVDALFCPGGCVNGPAAAWQRPPFDCRRDLIRYAGAPGLVPAPASPGRADLVTAFAPRDAAGNERAFSEEQIRAVLAHTGKMSDDDHLNCGACGYSTCRDKALAVLCGMAESDMCIPHMRRLAENRTDRIIETSPNGIVILDEKLHIVSINPAFQKMFGCSLTIAGSRISCLMDPEPFERLATGAVSVIDEILAFKTHDLLCRGLFYRLQDEDRYVGIFVNVSDTAASRRQLDDLRQQTIAQARELLDHQITLAQNIACMLGESTAQGEELVANLMKLAGANSLDAPGDKGLPR
ncbi:MAG: 4Fe-4S binding protein [Planctomycetota bacterium]|nr:4Fe-4S binding protein [Planctomycetota bacterium]